MPQVTRELDPQLLLLYAQRSVTTLGFEAVTFVDNLL